jgi:HEPN domain-containing protein
MKSEEHIQFWLEGAAHDLDAAESLFAAGKHDWCLLRTISIISRKFTNG